MSGQTSNDSPISSKGALNRLSLSCAIGWALLMAASLVMHSHDGLWGPAKLVASVIHR